jgi:tripartite-type tricarboxylate transporter receptor subunit TctC
VRSGEIDHVDAMFVGLSMIAPLARSSKVKIIGVSSLHRAAMAPEIPTIAEQGLPGFEIGTWFCLLAPAGTPSEAVQRLYLALSKVLQRAAVVDSFATQGLEIASGTPDQLDQLLKDDQSKWSKIIKETGLSE